MVLPELIFDLDDTLIRSFDGYVELHQRIASELGWPVPTADELVEYGPTWPETLARLWPGRSLDPFLARYEEIADDVRYPAFEGVVEALVDLHGRGRRLWIVSQRSRTRMGQRMAEAGLREEWFAGIFAHEDQPFGKPDPRCFTPVWDRIGGPRHALYVGDRQGDRLAAEAAGLPFLAVQTGPEARRGFPGDLEPTRVLTSAAEVPDWLARFE